MVLAHGLPIVIEVVAESMTPSIPLGAKVKVAPASGDLHPGDIVLLLADDGQALLLHRVMHLFSEGARRYVIHQGDAPKSIFATCPREAVVGRAIAFPLTPSRPLPTLDLLEPAALARFQRRRRACALYSLARRMSLSLRLEDRAPRRAKGAPSGRSGARSAPRWRQPSACTGTLPGTGRSDATPS